MIDKDLTYLACIGAFWETAGGTPVGAFPATVYFYLLHRMRLNDWKPLILGDEEVCRNTAIGRARLEEFRDALWKRGLLLYDRKCIGEKVVAVVYTLPEGLVRMQEDTTACAAPASPGNAIADYYRAHGDEGVAVCGSRGDEGADVPVEAPDSVAALMAGKSRASAQGEEILRAVLSPFSRATMEAQLMQNRVDFETYRALAEETVADWVEQGMTHDGPMGSLDIRSAVRHLQNTVRIKARALKTAPRTRDERRLDLMATAVGNLRRAQAGVYAQEPELMERPF